VICFLIFFDFYETFRARFAASSKKTILAGNKKT